MTKRVVLRRSMFFGMPDQVRIRAGVFRAVLFLVATTVSTFGQQISGGNSDSVTAFISKSMPANAKLAHPAIPTTVWGSTRSIIALYGYDDPADPNIGFNKIVGHVYCPSKTGTYRDIVFGPIDEDGGYPEVMFVFFANADKDKAKELVVLCKYKQQHHDYNGDFYETFIFDNPGAGNKLTYLEKLSEKFFGCECTYTDGKVEKALYKNAESIKARLKRLGYAQ